MFCNNSKRVLFLSEMYLVVNYLIFELSLELCEQHIKIHVLTFVSDL
jgi:hypothetical protein